MPATQPVPPSKTQLRAVKGGRRAFSIGDQAEIADRLLEIAGTSVWDEGSLWSYNSPVYRAVDDDALLRTYKSFAGVACGEDGVLRIKLSEGKGALAFVKAERKKEGFFADAAPGFAFANGFVTVSKDGFKLQQHSPRNRARHSYAFNFNETLCPIRFLAFLNDVFLGDDDRQQKIDAIQEGFGAALVGIATKYQRCFGFYGAHGSNGKSTLLKICSAAFPADAQCSVPPHDWGDVVHRASIAGKRLNCVAELDQTEIVGGNHFKGIISGDPCNAKKLYKDPISFLPRAAHMFSLNYPIRTADQTSAFWRRWILITFHREYKDATLAGPGDAIANENLDREIIESELPAIVCWMLHGAVRLLQRGGYTIPASHHPLVEAWRGKSDPVLAFLGECTRPLAADSPLHWGTTPDLLYKRFRTWATDNGYKTITSATFADRMTLARIPKQRVSQPDKKGKRYYRIEVVAEGNDEEGES